jgi:hypothetical protein
MRRRQHRRLISLAVLLLAATTTGSAASGTPPGQQPPSLVSAPTISGTPQQGKTLTGSTGTWNGVSISYANQWKRCDLSGNACAPIGGATGTTYALAAADVGSTIRFAVTATNKNGSASSSSAQTAVVAPVPAPAPPPPPSAPVNSSPPSISGTPQAGLTLSASTGTWSGSPTSYGYQWKRCDSAGANCASISGATGSSYLLASGDVGATMRVVASATNVGGTTSATSAQTAAVAAAPTWSGVTLSSSPANGATVSGSIAWIVGASGSGVARIDFLIDGVKRWTEQVAPYYYNGDPDGRLDTTTLVNGSHTLIAIAYNGSGVEVGRVSSGVTVSNSATSPTPTPIANGRFGLDDGGNLETLNSTDLARYLDGVKASGAKWLRVGLYWCSIMAGGPNSYNWSAFDNIVNQARARGINILGVLIYTPAWARPAGTTAAYPPTNLNDYANFVHVAAAHFGALGVHTYEIWNEPNLSSFWMPGPDAARYTQLLKLAYPAIKSSDPSATVVTAGLSPGGSYGSVTTSYINPITFLERMYQNGAHGYFNAVGWHPYSFPYGLGYYTWSAWSQMSETSPSARSIMTAYGDSGLKIWPTEMGAPTGTSSQAISETAQAQLVTDMYAKLKAWSWAGPGFLYNYRDKGTNLADREQNFGIIRWDWSLKPSFTAYKNAAAGG